MIKHINHQNVSTTPFVAAKARVLSNTQNEDTIILEPNVYASGTNISLDYIDYNSGDPVINRECNIALEQQDADVIQYEEGITGSATFNFASDARNTNGTYKSLVHRQTKNAFYNTYRNPTEIFGVEHIDFPLSKTLRNLSSQFRMFTIPPLVFGDKIQPQSIKFYDTLLDDNVEIFDDGYQNLIAGYNLFSKVQEIRTLGNFIFPGTSSACIISPTSSIVPSIPFLFGSYFVNQVNLIWMPVSGNPTGYSIERSTGNISSFLPMATMKNVTTYNDTTTVLSGSLIELLSTSSYYYRMYSFNSVGVSGYSNIVKVPVGAVETWEEYFRSQSSEFNGGLGDWDGIWKDDAVRRFVSSESFDQYTNRQTSSFTSGYGWSNNPWAIEVPSYFVTSESFEQYTNGQSTNFTGGFGWNDSYSWNVTVPFMVTESFEEYTIGQTANFNGGFGWSTNWKA